MSAPGRPKREYRSAQHEGTVISAPGRPKRQYRVRSTKGGHQRAGLSWARTPECAARR